MNGIKKLFNWIAEHYNAAVLFPKEWYLEADEKAFLKTAGYTIEDVKIPAVATHYAMPPIPGYTVQYVYNAHGETLSNAEVEHVSQILTHYRAAPQSPPNIKPE